MQQQLPLYLNFQTKTPSRNHHLVLAKQQPLVASARSKHTSPLPNGTQSTQKILRM